MQKTDLSIQKNQTLSDLKDILPEDHLGRLTTEQLAAFLGVKPGTVRRAYCIQGHYLGLIPRKLQNRRLAWVVR